MGRRKLCRLALVAGLLLGAVAVRAEPGVTAGAVRVGMVNALSGPAAGLGSGMKAGVQAYFDRVNAAGGVNGRQLVLISRDDGYEPARSAAITQQMIDSGSIFALLGYVGTPTSRAAMPIVLRAEVPYLFPFTGAEALRSPVHRWVFNVRASYFDETEAMVERMTRDLGIERIALLMQDDSFGETVKGGLLGALHKRRMHILAEARIRRNSLEVAPAVEALHRAEPDAIFFVGTYKQLATAIKQARALGSKARFFTVSFIGTENFIAEAGADGDGVYISQVMPSPQDASQALIRDYRRDIAHADIGYTSLEGYVGAAVFVQALRQAGAEPTRANLINALEFLGADLGGFRVEFSPIDHQGSDAVFLTRIQAGKAMPVEAVD
ncbi:Leucine-, isoleucine-, valine-, threonine-, and alanine-binding protein [Pseudomonas sp. 8AS]|uniref:ABC transporter substrate-binding protein n=1 Tax=Pseudomonas sp. 8AS TaxID=2653163 RepID=UPI0012F422AF|nr:ABC transporter substrate-binding protein [Pseudomonas sp. 8AS]VXB33541.1 Leucine-, isoleucine-, valine-, threonine-, and alanine-binding protein [Pseudomonas sp. 8AS]